MGVLVGDPGWEECDGVRAPQRERWIPTVADGHGRSPGRPYRGDADHGGRSCCCRCMTGAPGRRNGRARPDQPRPVRYVAAIGYRRPSTRMYGVDYTRRGAIARRKLALLLRAKTGESFKYEGSPYPRDSCALHTGGPPVGWGWRERRCGQARGSPRVGLHRPDRGRRIGVIYEETRAAGHVPGVDVPAAEGGAVQRLRGRRCRPGLGGTGAIHAAWTRSCTPSGTGGRTTRATPRTPPPRTSRGRRKVRIRFSQWTRRSKHVRSGAPLTLHPLGRRIAAGDRLGVI